MHYINPTGWIHSWRVPEKSCCLNETLAILASAAFMQHDNKGHSVFMYYSVPEWFNQWFLLLGTEYFHISSLGSTIYMPLGTTWIGLLTVITWYPQSRSPWLSITRNRYSVVIAPTDMVHGYWSGTQYMDISHILEWTNWMWRGGWLS